MAMHDVLERAHDEVIERHILPLGRAYHRGYSV